MDAKTEKFLPWITSYNTQIDLSPDWAVFEESLIARKKLDRTPTSQQMSAEDLAASIAPSAMRSQVPIEYMDPTVFQDIARRAFCDCCGKDSPNPGATEPIWPKVRVQVTWSGMDVGDVLWTAQLLKRNVEEAQKAGKVARKVELTRIDGGNHFVRSHDVSRRPYSDAAAGTLG